MADRGLDPQELSELASSMEGLAEGMERTTERAVEQLGTGSEPEGFVDAANRHLRRYLPFYALATVWILSMALLPVVHRGAEGPTAPQQVAQPGAGTGQGEGQGAPSQTPSGTGQSTDGQSAADVAEVLSGSQAAAADTSGGPSGGDGASSPSVDPPDVPEDGGEDDGEGEGDEADDGDEENGGGVVTEDDVDELRTAMYEAGGPAWDGMNEAIGVIAPPLVELAIQLQPVMQAAGEQAGDVVTPACEGIGLAVLVYSVLVAPDMPPVDLVALTLPVVIMCGEAIEAAEEAEEAEEQESAGEGRIPRPEDESVDAPVEAGGGVSGR